MLLRLSSAAILPFVATATLVFAVLASGCGQPALAREGLDPEEVELKVLIEERAETMIETLSDWVGHNTGSGNTEGLGEFAQELVDPLEDLGFEVELQPGEEVERPGKGPQMTGPRILARREAGEGSEKPLRILLSGHFDTVFEPESPFQELVRSSPSRATGPGVVDMKGGLIVMFEALSALRRSGDLERASWTVVLNSDEETGSLGSRTLIEGEARRAEVGFVFEAAYAGGAMVRSRRGLGQFHLTVEGVAAHAGSAHDQGRSAMHELATKILRIESLTDYERGLTLNVGTVRAGTKRNIVPEHAEAWIDMRYDGPELGEEAKQALEALTEETVVDGTTSSLWGTLHRPPKLATPEVDELLAVHRGVAGALGVELPDPVHAGGGTDGSLMGATGLATLDSMGVVGGAAHTDREFIDLDSLPRRAAIAAVVMRRLILKRVYGPGTER